MHEPVSLGYQNFSKNSVKYDQLLIGYSLLNFINLKGRIPRVCLWMNVKFGRRASSEVRRVEKVPRTCPWDFH